MCEDILQILGEDKELPTCICHYYCSQCTGYESCNLNRKVWVGVKGWTVLFLKKLNFTLLNANPKPCIVPKSDLPHNLRVCFLFHLSLG